MESVRAAIELAYVHQVPILLNPAPAASVPLDLLKKVTVLTPNEAELKTLIGQPGTDDVEEMAVKFYHQSGVGQLVVTLGAQGALVIEQNALQRVPACSVRQVVDTTACGDAFSAALAVKLGQGASLTESVRYANGAGALTATRPGAQSSLPYREELDKFLS